MARGKSELMFERYLNSLGYREVEHFEYEPDIGETKHPDYILRATSPHTLFEVKSYSDKSKEAKSIVEEARENTKLIEAGLGLGLVRKIDIYSEGRRKIHGSLPQLSPYKKKYPCVLVLDKANGYFIDFSPERLASIAFGDTTGVKSESTGSYNWIFGENGILRSDRNRVVSGIIGLEVIKPEEEKILNIFRDRSKDLSIEVYTPWKELYDQIIIETRLSPSIEALKATIIINPYAYIALDHEIFRGQFDEIWGFDKIGKFIKIK